LNRLQFQAERLKPSLWASAKSRKASIGSGGAMADWMGREANDKTGVGGREVE